MAKSKKALKALRRRQAAKGRSRALKQREDYTLGGRVKAYSGLGSGFQFDQSQVDAAKKAAEDYKAKQAAGNEPSVPQKKSEPPVQPLEQETTYPDASNNTEPPTGNEQPPTGTEPSAGTEPPVGTEPPAREEPPASTIPITQQPGFQEWLNTGSGSFEDWKKTQQQSAEEETPTTTTTEEEQPPTGSEPPIDSSAPESPFDYSNLNIDANTEIRQLRLNDDSGFDNFIVSFPWGALKDFQKEALQNIYDNYPYQTQETDRAKAVYNYLNEQLGFRKPEPEPEEEVEEDPDAVDLTKAPDVDYEAHLTFLMEKNNWTRQKAEAHNATALTQTGNFADYNKDDVVTNKEWADWKKLADLNNDGTVTFQESSDAVIKLGGKRPEGTTEAKSVGDPASGVLDEIYDKARRDRYRLDRPEAFETATTPQAGTQLTDRTLDAPTDVSQRTTAYTDAPLTRGTAQTSAAQGQITPTVMEAYNQAEANYFDKYPEARNAILEGGYSNIFDYHAQEGKDKGYSLEFDTSKIAQTDFNRLATASRADLTETTAATRSAAQEEAAKAGQPVFTEDLRSQVDPVTGTTFQLAATPAAEKQQRLAITDETAATGTEAIIQGSVGYEAAERREVKGEAASGAARSLLQEVGELPADITEVILDNPAQITAQIDTQPVEVQAAIAALPPEALISAQLETLLAGIDEGTTPTWARPAVQLVESRLNARGLSVSTVGRDALFNAIIQTALPIAQNNAAALQQRANQNLSNEQQANLQQASQDMQLRLTNVANRQTAETQSAQLAQQIKLTQGEIKQQTALTESQERQQVRLQSLQNEQQAAMANLGNDQQIELANLQVEAERLGANQNAENQEKLAEMQVAAGFMQKNEEFVQQMELANLSNDQQMRLSFLTAKNQAESENLTANQQTELANLNKRLEVNKLNASLAQQMGLAQLNVDQQSAIQNAATVANMDLTKFSSAQQIELANSKFMQTATLQDLNNRQQVIMQEATTLASLDLQAADSLTKVSIENARNFLQKDLTNLNATQQSYMLDAQQSQQRMLTTTASENASKQFNATSQNQTDQFMASLGQQLNLQNTAQTNAMAQFNTSEANRLAAVNAGNTLDAAKFSNQINTQIDQFNTQIDFQRDQWNKQNAQAVEQSNVNWRRQTNMAETAAQNAANQLQAQQLFTLDQQEQAFLWQQLRDEATYYRTQYESEQQRKTTLYATALANESKYAVGNVSSTFGKIAALFKDLAAPGATPTYRPGASAEDYLSNTG